jgi:hypothetical protein
MLGCRRPSITNALLSLCNDGLIECTRGHIGILDRQSLKAATCECFSVLSSLPKLIENGTIAD